MGIIADKIRRAIFGGEVRDSIADGIEVVEQLREDYDNQVINAGNSNAEIVDARGNYAKLKERLDKEHGEVISQLDTNTSVIDINTSNIDSLNQKINNINMSPKGGYNTVEELKSAHPNGDNAIYTVTADNCWYYWDGSSWLSGGAYLPNKIGNSSINQHNISRNLINLILNNNIAQGVKIEKGFFDTTNGNKVSDENWLRCETFLSVNEGELYFLEIQEIVANTRVDIIFWDDNLNFISSKTGVESFIVPAKARFITSNFKYASSISQSNVSIKLLNINQVSTYFNDNNDVVTLTPKWRKGYVASSSNQYWTEGHIADAGASSTYKYFVVKLNKGDLLNCKIATGNNVSWIAEFNKNGYVKTINSELKQLTDFIYVADKEIILIIVNNFNTIDSPVIEVYPSFLYKDNKFSFTIKEYDGYIKSDNTVYLGSGTNYHISSNIVLKKGEILFINGNCSPSANVVSKNSNDTYTQLVVGINDYRYYSYVCKNEYEIVRVTSKDDFDTTIDIRKSNKLTGKTFNMLGDSYVHGHSLSPNLTAYSIVAVRNGMKYNEYGINGNGMVSPSGTGTPMVQRYTEMVNDADYIGVVGGRNDYNQSLQIGENIDNTTDTFKGGLNILYGGLVEKYIGKKIFAVTLWNFNDNGNKYAQAERDIGERIGVPIIDSNKFAGIYMRSEQFRKKYCLSSTDVSHLNVEGHKLYADWLEEQMLLL